MTTDILSKIKKYLTIGLITGTAIITPIKAQERLENYVKDGTITNPITLQPVEGIKVTMPIFDGATPIDTLGPLYTDNQGYYTTTITDVEDKQSPNNKTILKYYGNKIFTNNFDEKTLKIYTTNGQEVKSIKTSNPNIDINLEGLASAHYITVLEIDKKAYANIITTDAGKNNRI
ncbi:MAG: hypothetical protein KatS3mg002_0758 [Candidatus Woesearchaeota archaeon]|nr:MAG: hypothetical protein KatS3mg002_0758 [Candidatus Woesearchaeota archaeon]